MTLAVSYQFTYPDAPLDDVIHHVAQLRQKAMDLGFRTITPVQVYGPDDEPDMMTFGALYPGRRTSEEMTEDEQFAIIDIQPIQSVYFWATWPGIEPMVIGLARYPAEVRAEVGPMMPDSVDGGPWDEEADDEDFGGVDAFDDADDIPFDTDTDFDDDDDDDDDWTDDDHLFSDNPLDDPTDDDEAARAGRTLTFPTGLADGWHWEWMCKTQFACLPRYGGDENFRAAHKAVVAAVEHARTLGIAVEAHDAAEYPQHHDDQRLMRELERWNCMLAGAAGRNRDRHAAADAEAGIERDGVLRRPRIFEHPLFEHFEAKADRAFAEHRAQQSDADDDPGA